jgi:hypothetical protein
MARPRLTPLDYIQGYAACDKDAVGSAGSECEYDRVDFCFARRMVTMSTQSLPSDIGIVSLLHCHHFRCIACAREGGWSNSQIASRLGDVGADWG